MLDVKMPEVKSDQLNIDQDLPTLIYTSYNLDINWKKNIDANRIFLIE